MNRLNEELNMFLIYINIAIFCLNPSKKS